MKKIILSLLSLTILLISCASTDDKDATTNEVPQTRMKLDGAYVSNSIPMDRDGTVVEVSMYIRFISDTELICGLIPYPTSKDEFNTRMSYVEDNFIVENIVKNPTLCLSTYAIEGNVITVTPVSKPDDPPYSLIIGTDAKTGNDTDLLVLLSPDKQELTNLAYSYTPFSSDTEE